MFDPPQCTLNEEGVCVNCGGKGGKPGPCPLPSSGTDSELDQKILGHLAGGGIVHLRDLRSLFGKKGDKQDHNHPVNKAMVRLRDSGKVKVHGGERGEPYFSAIVTNGAGVFEQYLTVNLSPRVRVERRNGREFFVAHATLIVPGVLNGSRGPLLYPPDEVSRDPASWNGIPIVVYHPTRNGQHISGRDPDVQSIGRLYNTQFKNGKLITEAWFDAIDTQRVDHRVHTSLKMGMPIGLSTGLFTQNDVAPAGSRWHDGRPYTFIAKNYKPDHLAILPDQKGACSLNDGCGVLVNGDYTADMASNCFVCNEQAVEPEDGFWEEFSGLIDVLNKGKKNQSDKLDMTPEKACQIIKDGQVHGHNLTEKQRGMFGALCGKRAKVHNTDGTTQEIDMPEVETPIPQEPCVLNSSGFCIHCGTYALNCGGEGGKPGPCPSGVEKKGSEVDRPLSDRGHRRATPAQHSQLLDAGWKHHEDDDTYSHKKIGGRHTAWAALNIEKGKSPGMRRSIGGFGVRNEEDSSVFDPTTGDLLMPLTPAQKTEIVNNLTTNCGCQHVETPWKGMSADVLNKKTDEELMTMEACRKAMANNTGKPPVDPPAVNGSSPLTPDQWLKMMPPQYQQVWNGACAMYAQRKNELIHQLTDNIEEPSKTQAIQFFQTKDAEELQLLVNMMPKPQPVNNNFNIPAPNWFGAQGAMPNGATGMVVANPNQNGPGVPFLDARGGTVSVPAGPMVPASVAPTNNAAPVNNGALLVPIDHQKVFEQQYQNTLAAKGRK